MSFAVFTFFIGLALGFMGTMSLAKTTHALWAGFAGTLVVAILSATVSPAFLVITGYAVVFTAWRTNKTLGKKKHLNWMKLDKSNFALVKQKVSEGLSEIDTGDLKIISSQDTPDDFRDRALTQNPFRANHLKVD